MIVPAPHEGERNAAMCARPLLSCIKYKYIEVQHYRTGSSIACMRNTLSSIGTEMLIRGGLKAASSSLPFHRNLSRHCLSHSYANENIRRMNFSSSMSDSSNNNNKDEETKSAQDASPGVPVPSTVLNAEQSQLDNELQEVRAVSDLCTCYISSFNALWSRFASPRKISTL
jgi:hypothetical protein